MEMDTQQQLRQLQQQLAAREQEVAALREIAEAASELQSQDIQAAKVIELSKKNRSLNLLVEKERQKVAKLQQALSEASSGKESSAHKAADAKEPNSELEAATKELAAAKERLQHMTNRIGQMEQKVFLLETNNTKLARALNREVGDDIPLSKVLEEGTDWKGRREQIIHLKDTIRQLKEAAGTAGPPPASLAKHETAHRSVIGRMNKERGAEMQRMATELDAAKKAAEQLKLQYAGASCRRKVLEAEVVSLKDNLAVVLSKTQNDDKLIAALRNELARCKPGSTAGSSTAGDGDGMYEVDELRNRCSQLEEQVEQQQKVIRYLQGQQAAGGKGDRADQLQDENEELRQQLAALQDDLVEASKQRPGTSGMSSALRQQVMTLQEDNNRLRQQILLQAAAKPPTLHLTDSQQLVLEEAKQALLSESGSLGAIDEAGLPEEGSAADGDAYLEQQQYAES